VAKGKERLDVLLVQQGLFPSREKAKVAIMEGIIFTNGQRVDKPGMDFPETTVF
jgi:23S rRNA (cytidine1920-2'-O)/16S rRNA (cytidine1409-2'-O)-methyltransferase